MQAWNTAILVFDGVEVLDFAGPFEVFSRTRTEPGFESRRNDASAPFRVFTVAPSAGEHPHGAMRDDPRRIVATGGLRVDAHFTFDDCPRVDLLVVPGGFGTRTQVEQPATLDWIRRVAAGAQLVASVCTGAALLARAGLLRGKRATTHHGSYDWLASLDPTITVERGVRYVDDGVVSSAGVSAGIDMAFAVVEKRCGREVAEETARYIEYRWQR
ncbi:MAG: DJ-1/PfpI family protein [Candidatus Eisenbacteria bacterium]